MLQNGYPDYENHMAQHREYTKNIEELRKKYIREGASPSVLKKIKVSNIDWWKNHIAVSDKDFGEFLRRKKGR